MPKSENQRGLYGKFRVKRTDHSDVPGGKHDGCDYFVLDLSHDPFAFAAIMAYANKCADEYPALAEDLLKKAEGMGEWMAQRQLDAMTPAVRERWANATHNDPERR